MLLLGQETRGRGRREENQGRRLGREASFCQADCGGLHLAQHKPQPEQRNKLQGPFPCQLLVSPVPREAFLLGAAAGEGQPCSAASRRLCRACSDTHQPLAGSRKKLMLSSIKSLPLTQPANPPEDLMQGEKRRLRQAEWWHM